MHATQFLIERKGITLDTQLRAGIIAGNGRLTFQYRRGDLVVGRKTRTGEDSGYRSFYYEGDKALYELPSAGARTDIAFLVEGETDALRTWQELEYQVAVYGLSGAESDAPLGWLDGYGTVYLILDNDADGHGESATSRARRRIQGMLGNRLVQVHLPGDVKDMVEFFEAYDLEALYVILRAAYSARDAGQYHFNPLDLTIDPPPPDWLVQGLIAQGDAVLVVSEPGLGKSMVSMSLAVAVAEGHSTWLGLPLLKSGPVLYVDEENPEDEVYRRIHGFSLKPRFDSYHNLRYLSNQGIRLDRNPEKLVEEAKAYKPILVVLDSLIRLHTKAENDAGEMSAVFNDGIKPLAREVGATVIVLHHVNKTDTNNSFKATRGSGDTVGAPDTAIELRNMGDGGINLVHFKGRRGKKMNPFRFSIVDTETGLSVVQVADPF